MSLPPPSILPLAVDHLSYQAGKRLLLHDISFTIGPASVVALIGPNGSGKSLTLRLCHGLLRPAGGSIRWQQPGGVLSGHKRHGMVFQRPVMLRRSARANIVHAVTAMGVPEAGTRAEEALHRFGLAALADRPARLMSGGEQQRLAIARAWALRPQCLFMDEPTAHLDPGATRQIEEIIAGIAAEGVTILISTHDFGQARRLSQRVLFLHQGRLLEDRPTPEFFAAPQTTEARAFIAGDLIW